MKKILLAVVLGVAVVAGAQNTAQPAQGQPATQSQPGQQPAQPAAPPTSSVNPPTGSVNPPTGSVNPPTGQTTQTTQSTPAAAPVIKDPAEYNAYVNAIQQTDPNAKISGLEAFVTQYPNSIMKNQALEILMGAYQQTSNVKKTMETATKLMTADACNERALALLAYYDRILAQGGDPNGAQLLADGKKYGDQGLDCLPKYPKPEGTSDADFLKMKDQMTLIFKSVIGIADYQANDFAGAATALRPVADASPTDFSVVYPLALAYLKQTPPDFQNGIWFAARASVVAPPTAQAGVEKYAHGQYMKYRQDEEGWPETLAAAKAGAAQVPIKPPLTPADQAHRMVLATPPDKMDFAQWEFILSNGNQADQDTVWNAIKGKPVQMNGTVIKATTDQCEVHAAIRSCEARFDIAGSLDDIEAKKSDITLTFDDKLPMKLVPKDGASLDFQGNPSSYTPNPFVMTMEKGMLPKPKVAPKPPVHHKPAAN
ncbi:MAG: tetratricopeptide repeat protein [Candidatus Sulfotelmatobacter sp.]